VASEAFRVLSFVLEPESSRAPRQWQRPTGYVLAVAAVAVAALSLRLTWRFAQRLIDAGLPVGDFSWREPLTLAALTIVALVLLRVAERLADF
jgi:TRAP-type C4-dicarboxylate transport system permease small subunit